MIKALSLFPTLTCFSFAAFYIPGSLILKRLSLSKFNHFVISSVLGLALWGWQAWIFGWLKMRSLTYLYLLISVGLWIRARKKCRNKLDFKKVIPILIKEKLLILVIIGGLLVQLPAAWFFGLNNKDGISLAATMPSDHEWHASLIYQITKTVPPDEPAAHGIKVANYHYFGDLIIGEFIRIFRTPLLTTTFQFFSVLLSLFLGLSAVTFARTFKLGRAYETTLAFLLYFGGDINPLITFLVNKEFHFRMGAMESGGDLLTNYPRTFSVIFVLIALALLGYWFKVKQSLRLEIALALLIAASVGSKVNTGALVLIGLGALSLYYIFQKQYQRLSLLILSLIATSFVYFPVNASAGGLIYTGFWRVQNFIVHPELRLSHLELARQTYAASNSPLRVLEYNLIFFIIYTLATFGTKLIGVFQTKNSLGKIPLSLHLTLISGLIVCFTAGMFFIQSAGGANSFNFVSTAFIFLSIYTALSITFVLSRISPKALKHSVLAIIFILTAMRSLHGAWKGYNDYLKKKYPQIGEKQLNMYEYLRENTPPGSLFLSGDYPLNYLGKRNVYLGNEKSLGVLKSHGVDVSKREMTLEKITTSSSPAQMVKQLKELKIDYLILDSKTISMATISADLATNFYEDPPYSIIKIK